MWFIKVDNDVTLEQFCEQMGVQPKLIFNALTQQLIVILRLDGNNTIITNIKYDADNVFQDESGQFVGTIDGTINDISLYIEDENYVLADALMECCYEAGIRTTMLKIA